MTANCIIFQPQPSCRGGPSPLPGVPQSLCQRRQPRAGLPALQGIRDLAGEHLRIRRPSPIPSQRRSRVKSIMAPVIDLPPAETLRPDQAIGELGKLAWDEVIGIGVTSEGEFEVINSAMTAERALWLIEWAKRWAMGLEIDE